MAARWNRLLKVVKITGCGCAAYVTCEYLCKTITVTGPSMEPTFYPYDVVFVENLSPWWSRDLNTGDIVIARSPSNPMTEIIKRVVGMPGEKMCSGSTWDVVPRGHVWLEGDNSSDSYDSREFGAVPQALIRSRVLFKIGNISPGTD